MKLISSINLSPLLRQKCMFCTFVKTLIILNGLLENYIKVNNQRSVN